MDKLKNNPNLTPALIVKLILALVFLLTAAFVSGVVIGKNGRRNIDRTSSDEEGINEKLSACIFNSDELRGKYLKLRDAAREKGLVDENDVVDTKVICKPETKTAEKSVEPEPEPVEETQKAETVEQKTAETASETPRQEEPKPEEKPVETKSEEQKDDTQKPAENVETFHETSVQKESEPAKKSAEQKPEKAKTIDEILTEKKAEPKKGGDTKCRFSIQLAFLDSAEQVKASKKEFKSLKLRVVDGESKGKKWYKVRTGCFDSREAAESELVKVKKIKKDAFIVSE